MFECTVQSYSWMHIITIKETVCFECRLSHTFWLGIKEGRYVLEQSLGVYVCRSGGVSLPQIISHHDTQFGRHILTTGVYVSHPPLHAHACCLSVLVHTHVRMLTCSTYTHKALLVLGGIYYVYVCVQQTGFSRNTFTEKFTQVQITSLMDDHAN